MEYDAERPIEPLAETLTAEELAYLSVGAFQPGLGALSVIGNAATTVAGAAGESCGLLKDRGIPTLVMADGPAGLRLSPDYTQDEKGARPLDDAMPEGFADFLPAPVNWLSKLTRKHPDPDAVQHQYCTAIPIGTCLAQSWDPKLAEACGDLVGEEMQRFGVHLWLAPALNIHRDIRCGRNFEYFSEDPLISGKFAAALTRGVQKHPGCGVTIKHFAANNQEFNRYFNNSRVSERAMREIYLKGFQIAVEEGRPKAVMTSYNLLNGTHTSERRRLIENVLRCEFGFDGIIMTDWIISLLKAPKGSTHPAPHPHEIVAAGNDLVMPGGKADVDAILDALDRGHLDLRQLQINVSRLIRLAGALAGS